MIPFENSIDTFDLRGDHLKTVFEHAVKHSWSSSVFDGKYFIQVSGKIISLTQIQIKTASIQTFLRSIGLRIVYNLKNEAMNRVVSIDVMTPQGAEKTPVFQPLNTEKYYKIIATSFVADGGDGFEVIKKYKLNHT